MKSSFSFRVTLRYLVLLISIFLLYTLAGKVGLSLAYVNASTTAIWPPTGIAIAALLLFGYRVWPAIFVGAFVVNLTTQGNIATSLGIAFGNTLEGLLAVYLINRFAHGKNAFDHVLDVSKFTGIVLISVMVSATVGAVTLLLGGYAHVKDFWMIWFTWWFGDIGGALIVAPVILIYNIQKLRTFFQFNIIRIAEFLLFFFLIILVPLSIFSGNLPFDYLVYPILVWGAFRFGRREVTTGVLVIALIAVWYTVHGMGPFALPHDINRSLLRIAFYLSTISFSMMAISAALLERSESKAALSSSEERFKSLIEKSFDAIVLIDPTSRIIYASPSFEKLVGFTPKEIVGTIGFNLIIPEDRERIMAVLAKLVLKPGGVVTVEYRTQKKDKRIIWVEATGTNLLLDSHVGAVVVNFRDITERHMSEEKLSQEKAEDEAMLSSIGEGIIATDDTGKVTLINQAACDMLKWKAKDLIGKDLIEVVPMQDGEGRTIPAPNRPFTHVLKEGKELVTSPHNYYVRSDGSTFPIRFTLSPIILDKKIIGTVEAFRNITQETEVDRAKSEFVSLASHQLRTPLTTINWYIERIMAKKNEKIPAEQKKYIQEVYHASRRMVLLINALLNVSRLELGTFVIEPEKVSLPALIRQQVSALQGMLTSKKMKIVTHFSRDLPDINADPKFTVIVLQNLLSNAIKYSHEKGIIDLSILYSSSGYLIEVKDTGYGIPQKDQDKIFTKMFRADNAKILDQDGTGLGLYLVKSIVDTTGGKIWFASKEGKGTTFFVSYPATGMKKHIGTKELR